MRGRDISREVRDHINVSRKGRTTGGEDPAFLP